jgi:hypothetical protein
VEATGAATAPGRARRRLLVVADDLGYDPAIDEGILEAHARGIVSAASAMVDTPFAAEALRRAPASLAVGLHLVLRAGAGVEEVAAEARRQVDRFEALRGAGPAHLDGHRHAHAAPAALAGILPLAAARRLRVRALHPAMRDRIRDAGGRAADHFLGDAALRPCWTSERLLSALAGLAEGSTELMCHPGRAPTHARTSFGREREGELAALCDPRAAALLRAARVDLAGALGDG